MTKTVSVATIGFLCAVLIFIYQQGLVDKILTICRKKDYNRIVLNSLLVLISPFLAVYIVELLEEINYENIENKAVLDLFLKAISTGFGIVIGNQAINYLKNLKEVNDLKKLIFLVIEEQEEIIQSVEVNSEILSRSTYLHPSSLNEIKERILFNIDSLRVIQENSIYKTILLEQKILENQELKILNIYFSGLNASVTTSIKSFESILELENLLLPEIPEKVRMLSDVLLFKIRDLAIKSQECKHILSTRKGFMVE